MKISNEAMLDPEEGVAMSCDDQNYRTLRSDLAYALVNDQPG